MEPHDFYYYTVFSLSCEIPLYHATVNTSHFVTLRAKLSGAVYCTRSCLWVCLCVCLWVGVCYHDNSKLRASISTKLGL